MAIIGVPEMGKELFRRYMKSKYVMSILHAGGEVRWIDLENPEKAVEMLLQCDGLLLPGGPDIEPKLYGHEATEKCGEPNKLRDRGEWAMLDAFLPTGKPILGICRGMQFLNVYMGGTMHQDITDMQHRKHMNFPRRRKGCHWVKLPGESKLKDLVSKDRLWVNSMHHQAADQLGKGLKVCAVSEDGFVEAVELENHPFCIGVQWHPEHMSKDHPDQRALFDAFLAVCENVM